MQATGCFRRRSGGYLATWDIWGPAPIVATQADHSSLLSARVYEEQILPFDLEVARACPLCVFHLHNNGLHVAPALMERPEISAIEVVIDPYPDRQAQGLGSGHATAYPTA